MHSDYGSFTDNQLAGQVRAGDPEAFVELSARYAGLVRGKAAQFAGSGAWRAAPEQEDLLQEGFLGLYAAALTYDPEAGASFSTYAGVCVYNRMVSAARSHQSPGNRPLNESLPLDLAGELPTAAWGPEDVYELRENYQGMWERIDGCLTPLERRVVRLYLEGCRRGEAERQAGLTVKQFDNALHRARIKLKNLKETGQ